MKKIIPLIAVCGLLITHQSQAACKATSTRAETIRLPIGKIIVPHHAKEGDVIYTSPNVPVTTKDYFIQNCSKGEKVTVEGKTNYPSLSGNNDAFPTGVDGIGVRITWVNEGGKVVFGSMLDNKFTLSSDNAGRINIWASGNKSYVKLELIKTKSTISSGSLDLLTNFGTLVSDKPSRDILNIVIQSSGKDGGTVVSPSCELIGGSNMEVNMGKVGIDEFNRVGKTAGDIPFTMKLKCGGSFGNNGTANLYTSFSGTLPGGLANSSGVLVNDKTENGAAKGIGIQVLKNNVPITFEEKYFITQLNNSTDNVNIPLTARYYQYGDNPTAGSVESHMTYNITYD